MENNKIKVEFYSLSINELFARNVLSCFALRLNPSISEIADIKTAVSEAVTNSIVHGYPNSVGKIEIEAEIIGKELHINVHDFGVGIDNVEQALTPFFTSKPQDERSGMGFTIMENFMDEVVVKSEKGKGVSVYMKKLIK